MPIYEYECPNCGYHIEIYLKRFKEECPQCPTCRSKTVRQIAKSGFILAGEDWPGKAIKKND